MSDHAVRIIGAVLGVVVGAVIVIYLDRHREPAQPTPAAQTGSVNPTNNRDQNEAAARAALEKARLQLAADAERALDLLRQSKPSLDPPRPEVARLAMLPENELRAEIELAYTDVGDYASHNTYAPERHAALYRRVNTFWDIRGLEKDENAWLGEAVTTLNELAVRHAEKSHDNGRHEAVVRVAMSLGDWAYRLNPEQELRLASALEATLARLRTGP